MMNLMTRLCKEEEGQGMVEYGLILALIAIVAIGVITALGGKIKNVFSNANNAIT
jgi:pilus assembly protein Flp/PilA